MPRRFAPFCLARHRERAEQRAGKRQGQAGVGVFLNVSLFASRELLPLGFAAPRSPPAQDTTPQKLGLGPAIRRPILCLMSSAPRLRLRLRRRRLLLAVVALALALVVSSSSALATEEANTANGRARRARSRSVLSYFAAPSCCASCANPYGCW